MGNRFNIYCGGECRRLPRSTYFAGIHTRKKLSSLPMICGSSNLPDSSEGAGRCGLEKGKTPRKRLELKHRREKKVTETNVTRDVRSPMQVFPRTRLFHHLTIPGRSIFATRPALTNDCGNHHQVNVMFCHLLTCLVTGSSSFPGLSNRRPHALTQKRIHSDAKDELCPRRPTERRERREWGNREEKKY